MAKPYQVKQLLAAITKTRRRDMNLVDHYTYRVVWSEDDQEFAGLCAEFPSLSWLDPDRHVALDGITTLVKDVLEDMQKSGEAMVEPLTARKYSGELRVRMPPAIHQRLAIQAAEASLNALIVRRLA